MQIKIILDHLKAGPYSGILFGITNTFAQIPGFLTPLLVSEMTQNVKTHIFRPGTFCFLVSFTKEVLSCISYSHLREAWLNGIRSTNWLALSTW